MFGCRHQSRADLAQCFVILSTAAASDGHHETCAKTMRSEASGLVPSLLQKGICFLPFAKYLKGQQPIAQAMYYAGMPCAKLS